MKATSGSGMYYLPRLVSSVDPSLMSHIDELHLEHAFMEALMLRDQFNREWYDIGRKHVDSLERFNRIVRHEWLNLTIFESIAHAQETATRWLWYKDKGRDGTGRFNHRRLLEPIGYIPPAEAGLKN